MDPNINSLPLVNESGQAINNNLFKKTFNPILVIILLLLCFCLFIISNILLRSSKSKLTNFKPPTTSFKINSIPSSIPVLDNSYQAIPFASTLYFKKGDNVYELLPSSSQPHIFYQGLQNSPYAFSSDGKTFANMVDACSIKLTNLENKDIKNIELNSWYPTPTPPFCGIILDMSWSPKKTILLVESNWGDIEGSVKAIQIENGKILSTFDNASYQAHTIIWLDENMIYRNKRDDVDPIRPWGSGKGYSIVRTNIASGNDETLFKADGLNDYEIVKYNYPCLYYSKTTVNTPEDWIEKTAATHYCFNVNLNQSIVASDKDISLESSSIKNQIEKLFPQYKGKILKITQNLRNTNMILFESSYTNQDNDTYIYFYDLSKPNNIPIKVGKGYNIYWF